MARAPSTGELLHALPGLRHTETMTDNLVLAAQALTPKQRLFVNEYLVDFNGTQAAIRAGYEETRAAVQAHDNLKLPHVAAAVESAIADRVARLGISQDWVVARLVENAEQALRAVPVYDREGNETGEYTYQGNVANKALELLGKHVGMFGTKLELTGADGGPLEVANPDVAAAIDRFTALAARAIREASNPDTRELPPVTS